MKKEGNIEIKEKGNKKERKFEEKVNNKIEETK